MLNSYNIIMLIYFTALVKIKPYHLAPSPSTEHVSIYPLEKLERRFSRFFLVSVKHFCRKQNCKKGIVLQFMLFNCFAKYFQLCSRGEDEWSWITIWMGRLRWQFRRASQQFRTTNRPEDSQFADSITTVVTSIVAIHYECRAEALSFARNIISHRGSAHSTNLIMTQNQF